MKKCKTELDIKLNEHLINAAREIQLHCRGTMDCDDCIFYNEDRGCRVNVNPENWEVDSEKL